MGVDNDKIKDLKKIALCSVDFMLPHYTFYHVGDDDKIIQGWSSSSQNICKIDVVNGSDVHTKIDYIKWTPRRELRIPLQQYFLHLFDLDYTDAFLMLECKRVLDCILRDLQITMTDAELSRNYALSIYDAVSYNLSKIKKGGVRCFLEKIQKKIGQVTKKTKTRKKI